MIRAIAIIGVAALAVGVIIYSFFDCLRSDPRDIRGIKRGPWIVVILLLPVIGGILWLTLGRPRYAPASSQPSRGKGPDDDPNFLRQLDEKRRAEAAEAQLEEWERRQKSSGAADADPGADAGADSEAGSGTGSRSRHGAVSPDQLPGDEHFEDPQDELPDVHPDEFRDGSPDEHPGDPSDGRGPQH